MVKTIIYKDEFNYIRRYRIKGHADFDDYGRDIVCAAISFISQNTLFSLVEVLGIDEKNIDYQINSDGYLDVRLRDGLDDKEMEGAQILLKSLELGIKKLVESYPKHVTLEYEGVQL